MTTDISIVRWDPSIQPEIMDDYEYDGGNSSSRLFERSRIKALAGELHRLIWCHISDIRRRKDDRVRNSVALTSVLPELVYF